MGDRRGHLQAAVAGLTARGVRVLRSSSVYDTDPVGDVLDQAPFLNACLEIETTLDPEALLDVVNAVERDRGRPAPGEPGHLRHGPRVLDVDVLLLGGRTHAGERLTLPHEEVLTRRFVLVPLLELDLDLALPDGRRVADALARLPLDEGVRRAGPPLDVGRPAPGVR